MNIAFFGSPQFVIPLLDDVHKYRPVSLVVTQPDKPVGREKTITTTPVTDYAIKNNISVKKPESLQGFELPEIDVAIVAAYGLIIPQSLLTQPKYGFINVHYSLLPKYRGASPVQTALVNGETKTGTTIMQMDDKLDHGDIISQKEITIDINDTAETLFIRLTAASAPLVENVLFRLENDKMIQKTPQDHDKATYTERITKQEAFVEFSEIQNALRGNNALEVHNKIRAYHPWPNVWTLLPEGKRCKIIRSEILNDRLKLLEIQVEGKKKTKDEVAINILLLKQ